MPAVLSSPAHKDAEAQAGSLRPFFVLWGGQALSLIGSQSVQFAVVWWLNVETGSAAVLATASFFALMPQVLLGPLLGAFVDRHNRQRVMLLADGGVAAASLVLAGLFAAGMATPAAIYALLFVRSIGNGLHTPAMLATTSLMLPSDMLVRIQGANQALQGGMMIIAAPIGALLLTLLPMPGVMLVDVATAAFAIVPLLILTLPNPSREPSEASGWRALMRDLREGVRDLRRRHGHAALVAIAAAINLWLVPAFALLPLLVSAELDGGAGRLATMSSVFGLGILAGGALLGAWGGFRKRITTAIAALGGLGLAVLSVGFSTAGWPATAAMLAVGLMLPLVNGPIMAILQTTIEPHMQGRFFSMMTSVAMLAAPIGLMLAGPMAELLGVRSWFIGGGIVCIIMAGAMTQIRSILSIEDSRVI
jgi:MFS transporter, DHA3 family, macrolide efflux protein